MFGEAERETRVEVLSESEVVGSPRNFGMSKSNRVER